MKKINVKIDKSIYVGMCILEISKTIMYDFHYYHVLPNFKNNAKICYTDTDFFLYAFYQNPYIFMKKKHPLN